VALAVILPKTLPVKTIGNPETMFVMLTNVTTLLPE
jgi:hypothetical protein